MREFHFYNRDLETLDRSSLRNLQGQRLRALASRMEGNVFYEEKSREAGIKIEELSQVDDLNRLPFTTKEELVEEQRAHPPFGRLLSYPLDQYRYFHQTSGTSGRPLKWLDSEEDWDTWRRCWGCVYRGCGVTEEDVVFCAFSFGPYISHWTAIEGARHIGALAISGGGLTSEQRLDVILENQCTVLVCTPTYALHLAEVARRCGIDLERSSVRITIHAGEPGASVPSVKRSIERAWGAACFDHAGATEVGPWAFDCEARSGAIHLNETEFIFDVIDPGTGRSVEEGARGELVATTLGRPGMPVLRYRTGDLVEMVASPCECGRSFARIKGGVLGRADDMLIVRGVNLYPAAIDNLVRGIEGVVEYEVEIRSIAGLDDLSIKIEPREGREFGEIQQAVLRAFRAQLNIRVTILEAASGSLPRYEFKAKRYKRV